jgi:hypothetical protein
MIRNKSSLLAELEAQGEILIKAAYYEVATGLVEFIDSSC